MEKYEILKQQYKALIASIKAQDSDRGTYFERHVRFNDDNKTIEFSGKLEIIKAIMSRVKIKE